MPDLLLELFSEEIPARMQAQAARDLERIARERLAAADLAFRDITAFAGPRRLTLAVGGLPAAQADRREERKGPRANAPAQAVDGFLRSTGLTRDQLTERDGVLYATLDRPGRPTPQIVAEMVEAIVRGFPWPKSMRWGAGTLRWVRPLQRILCTFDGEVVPFAIDGIASDNLTEGHRFMGDDHAPFAVSGFEDYAERLGDHYVVLDPAERRARISAGCRAVCQAEGLEWIEDAGLLDEVVGLAEWPVPILGRMDAAFLDLPPEVIATSMRVHQRYFAVRDPATGGLAPRFVVVANIEPKDGGATIAHGNARVLSARLADARFFWTQDQRAGSDGAANFDRWLKKLEGVTFHAKLGTMAERIERIAALAAEIAEHVGADPKLAALAARVAKADLASGMVGEFPELQGVMGGYYVRASGDSAGAGEVAAQLAALTPAEREAVADAVRDHYKPQGPSDTVPTAPLTVAVALADKLDTLVGFFAIDERPTGSKDPFALRRAALGITRLALSLGRLISLSDLIKCHLKRLWETIVQSRRRVTLHACTLQSLDKAIHGGGIREVSFGSSQALADLTDRDQGLVFEFRRIRSELHVFALPISNFPRKDEDLPQVVTDVAWFEKSVGEVSELAAYATRMLPRWNDATVAEQLLAFFADRLKVLLRDEGKRHDLVDAVFALGDDDLVRIVARVEALSAFLATEDGVSLLAGYKRAANILKAEAKKASNEDYALTWDLGLLAEPQEQALSAALRTVQGEVGRDLDREDFEAAMRHLSHLRAPVDAFFEAVFVNAPDPAVRLNRLRLLAGVRDAANLVADFSLVASA